MVKEQGHQKDPTGIRDTRWTRTSLPGGQARRLHLLRDLATFQLLLLAILCCPLASLIVFIYGSILLLILPALLGIKMRIKHYLSAALFGLPALAQSQSSDSNSPLLDDDPFRLYTINAENITVKLIGYGARVTSLLVPDRSGNVQDIVVGYDDPKQYLHDTETNHTYFGAVVGRYANRIKNGTFTLDGITYHIPKNENGLDTLHGGTIGYDQRNWTVTANTESSITFTLFDKAFEGFPGDVITHATFSVDTRRTAENPKGRPQLTTKLISLALTQETPIMLSNHIYWNLNAFKRPTILNDTFVQLPLSERYIGADGILVPNGTILMAADTFDGSPDFEFGKFFGTSLQDTLGLCGTGCIGYDNCYIVDRLPTFSAQESLVSVLRMNSSVTGISMELASNQQAVQIYSCNSQNGTIPIKPSQARRNEIEGQGGVEFVNKWGCVAIEPEGWIDAINQPEWGQQPYQIFSPESGPAINWATYQFGIIDEEPGWGQEI